MYSLALHRLTHDAALETPVSCVVSASGLERGRLLVRSTGYVVIELKTGKFQPEYAGKLNFYVALVDDVLRRDHHNETIGILICGTKNDRSVRYSLGRSSSPMAVAAYTYDKLPRPNSRRCPTRDISLQRLNGLNPTRTRKSARAKPEVHLRRGHPPRVDVGLLEAVLHSEGCRTYP